MARISWEKKLNHFFEANEENLIKSPDKEGEAPYICYLWDEDYHKAYDKIVSVAGYKENLNKHCYTLVEDDGNAYIVSGWHYVNRLGYFISTKEVSDDKSIRYF